MSLLINYIPLPSEAVMPICEKKKKKQNMNGIKPLDPTTNEQKTKRNRIAC